MPPELPPEKERELAALKREIESVTKMEISKMKKSPRYRNSRNIVRKTKQFLEKNDLVAVPSDKSNRMVITKKESFDSRITKILEDKDTYQLLDESRQTKIEKQANALIKAVTKNNFSKIESENLISAGSSPAQFKAFIKDHKDEKEEGFPLRPIASVQGTATEKVDWLVTSILTNLVDWVPSNIKNTTAIVDILKSTNVKAANSNATFISLDVVSMYPNIPLQFGLDCVAELAKDHWSEIDNKGLTLDQMMNLLKFICYNYEIRYKEKVYKQIKGCPTGAHFAPPFSIITMHKIEQSALLILEEKKYQFSPCIYKRYLDDIVLGPIERGNNLPETVLKTFNSINDNIQFTLEVPKENEPLAFLDITISVTDRIEYGWYVKPCHSNNSLRSDSWIPSAVKSNFIKSTVLNISEKCSNYEQWEQAASKLDTRFKENGYSKSKINFETRKQNRSKNSKSNKKESCLILDFVSDSLSRRIHSIIKKYDFDIRVINKPGKNISQLMSKNKNRKMKHDGCHICNKMPEKFFCSDRLLVYKFTCGICEGSYIGQTNRPFSIRYKEHMHSLNKKDRKSALSQHVMEAHSDLNVDFTIDILQRCLTPLETRLSEARAIDRLRPSLNRRHERNW